MVLGEYVVCGIIVYHSSRREQNYRGGAGDGFQAEPLLIVAALTVAKLWISSHGLLCALQRERYWVVSEAVPYKRGSCDGL